MFADENYAGAIEEVAPVLVWVRTHRVDLTVNS